MGTKKTSIDMNEIKLNLNLDDDYRALDKLGLVVLDLTVGNGKIKDILNEVGRDILDLREQDFPEDLRPDFLWIRGAITEKATPKSTGNFAAASGSMPYKKASIVAERICLLYEEVRTHCCQSRPLAGHRA